MAHVKAKATTQNVRDSQPKYLGVKLFGGQKAKIGSVIIRQRGTRFVPGNGTRIGSEDTIYAVKEGNVSFVIKRAKNYSGNRKTIRVVNIV